MIKDYIIKEIIGKGTYGTVYKVQEKNSNNIYALKQISLEGLTSKEISEVNQEVKILSSINSDFVVKYYNSFEEKHKINIVMEYCDGGDLNDFLKEKMNEGNKLDEDLIWKIFIKITIGLADIHKKNILHRDLKTLNIFLTKSLEIKIGDLGVAKVLSKGSLAKTVIGTPYYLSPEICEEKPYNDKSDVWALGCILYELCTFKHPFEARSQGALILKILNRKPDPIDSHYSVEISNLIDLLLDKKSEKRPTCEEILKYKVINKVKSFGLYEYIKKLDSNKNNYVNYNNNVKISKKIIDLNNINITKKFYSKNNSKENINKNIIINNNIGKNPTNKKQVSALNLIDNIKNNNLKFNNINQKIIHKKKNSEVKINVITIGDTKSKKPLSSVARENNYNKNNFMKYNNFFINNSNRKYKNEKIENVIISKKNNKINKEENSNINAKKIGFHQVKLIFKASDEYPNKANEKLNNVFRPKNMVFSGNKKENENLKLENDFKNEKKIQDNNFKKYIPKYRFPQNENIYKNVQIKIKQIPENNHNKAKEKENINEISTTKSDKYTDSNDNKKEKQIKIIVNNNKKYNLIISDNNKKQPLKNPNKKHLISLLPKTNNENQIHLTKDNNKIINKKVNITVDNKISIVNENKSNESIHFNDEQIIFSEKLDSPNFKIINNNNLPKVERENHIDNNKFQMTNESGDSIDDNANKEKELSNKKSNEIDIIDIYNSDAEESVKEIGINQNQIINKEINNLKEKIEKSKNELKKLMGEKDFNYIMNIHNIKEQNKVDEIYEQIENFANQNYEKDKNEKFLDLYLSLISTECQLDKKMEELKNKV